MGLQGPNISFPGVELNRFKDSESRDFRQESLEYSRKFDESLSQVGEEIKTIHQKLEEESTARINAEIRAQKAEMKAFWWQLTAITIGALTLIATIVFGLLTVLR